MKVKKGKPVKKYSVGGAIAAQVALGGLQALISGAQYFGGTAAANKLKAPSTATPTAFRDLYESAQNQQIVQKNLDEINRAAQTYLQALQAGGPQAVVAGIGDIAEGQASQTQDVLNAQMLREMKAAESLALADERAQGRARDVYETRFGEAQAARAAGLQNAFNAAGSVAKGLIALETGKDGFDNQKTADVAPGEMASFTEQLSIAPAGQMVKPMSKIPSLVDNAELIKRAQELSKFAFEDGGMMTGGKFSHKTNPIDIIRKGEKIGEMTGGEVILNPAQQKKLSKESAYFRQLLKKFNKQK